MARKKGKTTLKSRQEDFDKFIHVKGVREGETLKFRDQRGRLTKIDGRKMLVAEIWFHGRRTPRTLNRTKKGEAIFQKFDGRLMRKRILFLQNAKKGLPQSTEVKSKRLKINSHYTIVDNLEAKIPELAADTVTYSRRGNGSFIEMDIQLKREYEDAEGQKAYDNFVESVNLVLKSQNRGYIFLELAREIIHRLYKNNLRASGIRLSTKMGKRGKYVRSFEIGFRWQETKSLKDM